MRWVSETLQEDQAGKKILWLLEWELFEKRSSALWLLVYSRSCQRLCWRWQQLLSPGRPAADAQAEGCFLYAPTAQAAGGEETEPCRRRGLSCCGSPEAETSPGRHTARTLPGQIRQGEALKHGLKTRPSNCIYPYLAKSYNIISR